MVYRFGIVRFRLASSSLIPFGLICVLLSPECYLYYICFQCASSRLSMVIGLPSGLIVMSAKFKISNSRSSNRPRQDLRD